MRKSLLTLLLAAGTAIGATLNPIQLLNPAGSSNGQVIASTGASSAPAWTTLDISLLSGVLPVPSGGTGISTLTGLALGNGASAFSAYGGTSCTNQFPRSLNASGAATCASVANTDLANSSVTIGSTNVALGATASTIAGLTLTAPNIGAATATSINGNTITTGTGTLTIAAGKTATVNNTLTFAGTDATTLTFQGTDTIVGRASTDTLTNKTFDTAGTGNTLKINGTTISAVTGTGSAVLSAAPTLTGTTTAAAATINGGAINPLLITGAGAVFAEFKDTAATPNRYWIGTGCSSTNDGKFCLVDERQVASRLIIDTGGLLQLPAYGAGALKSDGSGNITAVSGINPVLTGITGSIGGGSLAAGACTSGTVAVTSSTTAMSVSASPVTYPGDGIFWHGYVSSAGTVTVKVCAAVLSTPTASTYNVRVIQ